MHSRLNRSWRCTTLGLFLSKFKKRGDINLMSMVLCLRTFKYLIKTFNYFYPADKKIFWSVHSAISNKGRTMVKQKAVHCHAWKTCTITYNKRASKPFPRLTMVMITHRIAINMSVFEILFRHFICTVRASVASPPSIFKWKIPQTHIWLLANFHWKEVGIVLIQFCKQTNSHLIPQWRWANKNHI